MHKAPTRFDAQTMANAPAAAGRGAAQPASGRGPAARRHPPVTLFTIPFESQMTAADTDGLRADLDLVTHLTPKPGASGASTGVVRLDHWSGLFLERGDREGQWILTARTWGDPPASTVHDWHLRTALAAHRLDPAVSPPALLPRVGTDRASVEVGATGSRRARARPSASAPPTGAARTPATRSAGRARTQRRDPLLHAVLALIGERPTSRMSEVGRQADASVRYLK